MTAADRDREAFEAWANAEHPTWSHPLPRSMFRIGDYADTDPQMTWDAWQAALTHARAQAGKPVATVGTPPMLQITHTDTASGTTQAGALDIVDGRIVYVGDMSLDEFRRLFGDTWAPYAGQPFPAPAASESDLTIHARQGGPPVTQVFMREAGDGALDAVQSALGKPPHPAPAQEPVAVPAGWQWRFRAIGKTVGEWSEWQDGRAPTLTSRSPVYEVEERPVYAAPVSPPAPPSGYDADDARLPCDVHLPPSTYLRKGVLMRVFALALAQREGKGDDLTTFSPPADSGEVEAPAQALASAVLNYYDSAASEDTRKGLFDEMVRRAKALASTPAPQPCPMCYGKGYHQEWSEDGAGAPFTDCTSCGGTGKVDAAPQPGGAAFPHCNGTGQRQDKRTGKSYPCPRCEPSPPQPGGAVKVKALEWVDRHKEPQRPNDLVAGSVVGLYQIRPSSDGASFRLFVPGEDYNAARAFDTLDAAKAAAQADYERRILSALSPSPSGWDAGAEAKETVATYLAGLFGEAVAPRHRQWAAELLGRIRVLPLITPPAGEG